MHGKWPIQWDIPLLTSTDETPGEIEHAIYEHLDRKNVMDDAVRLTPLRDPEGITWAWHCACANMGLALQVRRAVDSHRGNT